MSADHSKGANGRSVATLDGQWHGKKIEVSVDELIKIRQILNDQHLAAQQYYMRG